MILVVALILFLLIIITITGKHDYSAMCVLLPLKIFDASRAVVFGNRRSLRNARNRFQLEIYWPVVKLWCSYAGNTVKCRAVNRGFMQTALSLCLSDAKVFVATCLAALVYEFG